MTPNDAAAVAFDRYMQATARLALVRGTQLDLLDTADARADREFWRGTWIACEAEVARTLPRWPLMKFFA